MCQTIVRLRGDNADLQVFIQGREDAVKRSGSGSDSGSGGSSYQVSVTSENLEKLVLILFCAFCARVQAKETISHLEERLNGLTIELEERITQSQRLQSERDELQHRLDASEAALREESQTSNRLREEMGAQKAGFEQNVRSA